jgi:hypothetical protein
MFLIKISFPMYRVKGEKRGARKNRLREFSEKNGPCRVVLYKLISVCNRA